MPRVAEGPYYLINVKNRIFDRKMTNNPPNLHVFFLIKIKEITQYNLEIPMVRDINIYLSIISKTIPENLVKWTRPAETGALFLAGAWIWTSEMSRCVYGKFS